MDTRMNSFYIFILVIVVYLHLHEDVTSSSRGECDRVLILYFFIS